MKTLIEKINEALLNEASKKKINPKDIYFDDADLVWYDKTIGFRWDDGGIEMLPEYEDRGEEVLAILKRSRIYNDDFYLVKK